MSASAHSAGAPAPRALAPPIANVDLAAQGQAQLADLAPIFERVVRRGQFVGGDEVEGFEAAVAARCGTAYAVALNSGTDALILALKVAGLGPGDEVITAPNSFVASTSCIVHVGARPVFADVLPDQNIDPDAVAAAVTPRTKAILPVHLTGRVCRMDAILAVAERHGLIVVEDAAQAIGSRYRGRPAGAFGRFGCFSAHPLKNLNALGDAGFVTTDDADAAARLKRLRNHGLADRDTIDEWGWVSRMDALQAAVLSYRLESLDEVIAHRRAHAARYRERLAGSAAVFAPPCGDGEFNTFHTFVVQCERRDALRAHLAAAGIRTAVHYPVPIHLQPAARDLGHGPGAFPEAERQAGRILTLPVHQHLSDTDVDRVTGQILAFYGGGGA